MKLLLSILIIISMISVLYAASPGSVSWGTCPNFSSNNKRSASGIANGVSKEFLNELKRIARENEKLMITEDDINNINWEQYKHSTTKNKRKIQEAKTECASVTVPLLWDNATESKTVKFFVRKFERTQSTSKGKVPVWLLQGGPGGSGYNLYSIAEFLISYYDANDLLNPVFFVPDQRGTGMGTYLACDLFYKSDGNLVNVQLGHSTHSQECWSKITSKYTDAQLKGFGTTNAARDVLYVIEQEDSKYSVKPIVYGVSYGTFWLNRILEVQDRVLSKSLVSKAIADSVVPTEMDFLERDVHFEEAMQILSNTCTNSKTCLGQFDSSFSTAQDMVKAVYAKMTSNDCVSNISPKSAAYFAGRVLADNDLRRTIFSFLYRYNRCSDEDKDFLNNWTKTGLGTLPSESKRSLTDPTRVQSIENAQDFVDSISVEQRRNNNNLFYLVALGEITNRTSVKPKSYWKTYADSIPPLATPHLSYALTEVYDIVKNNLYTEAFRYNYASFSNSFFTMQCTTDPQTPLSFATNYWNKEYTPTSSNVNYFEYPNCVHAAIISTTLTSAINKIPTAGLVNVAEFMEGLTLSNHMDKMVNYDLPFDSTSGLGTYFQATGCYSLYESCAYPLTWTIIYLLIALVLCCCCPCILIGSIIGCVVCFVKRKFRVRPN